LNRKLRIIVSGMMAGDPGQGGATWAVLQYVLGFRELGHEVLFIEPVAAKALKKPEQRLDQSDSAAYFKQVTTDFGLSHDSALLQSGTQETVGVPYEELRSRARRADVLLNISGMLTDPELVGGVPIRIYLDLDPAFNQLWSAVQGVDMRFAGHTHFLTVGLALGKSDCPVPACGLNWMPTFQPIVLRHWPVAGELQYDGLTTIANWRGYGSVEYQGRQYGQKAHSLRQFMKLPTLTSEPFILALAIHPDERKDLAGLSANQWKLLDPSKVAGNPGAYRNFIQNSKAEFGIAKSGYVLSRCGWFSDRSVCYLASGRPVIAQNTRFGDYLPTGQGLFAFETSNDVLAAIDQLRSCYQVHARQARHIAEEYFDSRKVLTGLLEKVGALG
jgi:hypothetical protein